MFGFNFNFGSRGDYPYKVGLALSGGGARGVAHAGAIKAMLEVGLKPDIVAGVSAGAIVAALYASGFTPDEMLDLFVDARFRDFCELGVPNDGFFRMDRFKAFLKRNIPYENIEDLPVPIVIGATDFDSGERVAFESGPLAERVVASCSIPIVFRPVKIDGVRYVDGGVLANLPAWAIRDRCKFLAGVNVSPMSRGAVKGNLLDIAVRSFELMSRNNMAHDVEMCDMIVNTYGIARYKVFDLKGVKRVFRNGYDDTMRYFRSRGVLPR